MPRWNVRTYTAAGRSKPVDDWLRGLRPRAQAKVIWTIDLLEKHGVALDMPHARHLEDGIWELRIQEGGDIFRILYFHWKRRTFGLLHAFTKKTQRTPRQDIEVAERQRSAWLERAGRRAEERRDQ